MDDERLTEHLSALLLLVRQDAELWGALKQNEKRLEAEAFGADPDDPDAARDAPESLTLARMIADFIDNNCDPADDIDFDGLAFILRCEAREELGLPVNLDWLLDDGKDAR
jgi:hypothetical protein